MTNKKEFVKITFEDLEIAREFFENDRHFADFLLQVVNYYMGKETHFKHKLVAKYFQSYRKVMDFVMQSKSSGKKGGLKRVENQTIKSDTLEGVVKAPPQPNSKGNNSKRVNSKVINKNVLLSELKNSDVPNEDYLKIALMFHGLFLQNLRSLNVSTKQLENARGGAWINPVRLMMEKDGRTRAELREVYDHIQNTPFWHGNILSTDKLRKQFDKLLIQSRNEKVKPNNRKGASGQELAETFGKHFANDYPTQGC